MTSDLLTSRLNAVLARAQEELIKVGAGATRVHAVFGQVADDISSCEDSQLNIRVISITPPPSATVSQQLSCGPNELVVSVGLGTVRCVASIDKSGRPPSPETIAQEAAEGNRDMWALLAALNCVDDYPFDFDRVITSWLPRGPEGGVAGGEWLFSMRIPNCVSC